MRLLLLIVSWHLGILSGRYARHLALSWPAVNSLCSDWIRHGVSRDCSRWILQQKINCRKNSAVRQHQWGQRDDRHFGWYPAAGWLQGLDQNIKHLSALDWSGAPPWQLIPPGVSCRAIHYTIYFWGGNAQGSAGLMDLCCKLTCSTQLY